MTSRLQANQLRHTKQELALLGRARCSRPTQAGLRPRPGVSYVLVRCRPPCYLGERKAPISRRVRIPYAPLSRLETLDRLLGGFSGDVVDTAKRLVLPQEG